MLKLISGIEVLTEHFNMFNLSCSFSTRTIAVRQTIVLKHLKRISVAISKRSISELRKLVTMTVSIYYMFNSREIALCNNITLIMYMSSGRHTQDYDYSK